MTLAEARSRIGKLVRYTPGGELGEVVSVNDQYVFVRYVSDLGSWETQSKATRPEDVVPVS